MLAFQSYILLSEQKCLGVCEGEFWNQMESLNQFIGTVSTLWTKMGSLALKELKYKMVTKKTRTYFDLGKVSRTYLFNLVFRRVNFQGEGILTLSWQGRLNQKLAYIGIYSSFLLLILLFLMFLLELLKHFLIKTSPEGIFHSNYGPVLTTSITPNLSQE